jgi:tetratricopeptide (TPR) repeat protein
MKLDSRGLAVTTDSDRAIAAINHFIDAAVSLKPGMPDIIDAARREPDCPMLQIYAAALHSLAQSNVEGRSGHQYLDRARRAGDFNERERCLIDAVAAGCDGDFDRALALYEAIIDRWPRDILAVKIAEFHCFETGEADRQLRIMEKMAGANEDSPHAQAMYAFALELTGLRERAEQVARDALSKDPTCMWAQHCLAHVFGQQWRIEEGIEALRSYSSDWTRFGQYIRAHNWFHLAVLYLAQLDFARVLDAYRDHIWGFQSGEVVEHTDAILLLWYVELAGGHAGSRWREMARDIGPKAYDPVFPFLSATYVYALERAGESAEAERVVAQAERHAQSIDGKAAGVWKNIGIPQLRGTLSFARGRYDEAAAMLGPILDDIAAGGGSDEQRGVFHQSHFVSLARAGRRAEAQEALRGYAEGRPPMALYRRWAAEIGG